MNLTLWMQENQNKLSWILTLAFIPLSLLLYLSVRKGGGDAHISLEQQLPHHHLFAKTTRLIGEKQFEAALKEAAALKDQIKESPVLYLFNLVRIASLERELNLYEKEMATLKTIKEWLSSSACPPEAKAALADGFWESGLSLMDYINHRLSCTESMRHRHTAVQTEQ
jgi:hypothetical protein